MSAGAYVLYCADSGQVLLSHNENTPMGMASTTKIMTSLLALEYAASDDKEVEFTKEMIAEGSSMYLKVGDKVRLSDLAAGMMTVSGNDAANAVAFAVSGSMEEFAKLMNTRASQIGMKSTNFVTPSGLDAQNHYSTPYDMALLMSYAMENEAFSELTSKKSVTVDFIYPEGQKVTYNNHNRLLSMYEYCVGGKTGYTRATGRCLVTCAERDGVRLVAVTFNDRNDWNDHTALYEYGFERFTAVTSPEEESRYTVSVMGSEREKITAGVSMTKKSVVSREDADRVQCVVYLPPMVFAPVSKGDVIGKVVYTLDGETVLENDLTADMDAEYKETFSLLRLFQRIFS